MLKPIALLSALIVAGMGFLGTVSEADARCSKCGPLKPSYTYKTVNKVSHKTTYRNVTKTRYVQRIKKYVHVTRVRPVVYVHNVTRVHHRTVGVIKPVHMRTTQTLPTRVIRTSSVVNTYSCGCGR